MYIYIITHFSSIVNKKCEFWLTYYIDIYFNVTVGYCLYLLQNSAAAKCFLADLDIYSKIVYN